jgi:hypothetical protein
MSITTNIRKIPNRLETISVNIEDTAEVSKYFEVYDIKAVYSKGTHIVTIRGSALLKRGTYIYLDIIDERGSAIPINIPPLEEFEREFLPLRRFTFTIDDSNFNGVAQFIFVGTTVQGQTVRWSKKFAINKSLPVAPVNDRGAWEDGIFYSIGDVVQFNGSTFKTILDHKSSDATKPPNQIYWELFASGGYSLSLTRESIPIKFDVSNSASFVGANTTASVFRADDNITNEVTFTTRSVFGNVDVIQNGNLFSITGIAQNTEAQFAVVATISGSGLQIEKFVTVNTITEGQQGELGLSLLYRGLWSSLVTYTTTNISTDVVLYNGNYYYLPEGTGASLNQIPTGSPWVQFANQFESVATDILLAQDVTIRRTLTMGDASTEGEPYGSAGIIRSLGGFDSSGVPTFNQTDIQNGGKRYYILDKDGITAIKGSIGGISLTDGKLFTGTGTFSNANTGMFMSSSGHFSLGDKLSWDTNNLNIVGNVTITGGNAVTTSSFNSYTSSVDLEFQTVSSSANNALQEAILAQNQALGAFNSASTTFSNIADDNIADYTEVPYYRDLLNQIVSEYSPISSSAFTQGVTDSSWTNYSQSFVNYSQSLNVIVTTSQIDFPISGINNSPLFLTTRFNDYYNRKSIILDAITIRARSNAEAYALVVTPTDPLTGILKNNPTPSGQGLFMNSQNLGYYNSSNWQTFMSASGEFFLTSSVNGNYLFWRPSTGTLEIQGAINITGGNAVTTSSFDSYSSSVGMEFQTVSASANNALQEALLAQGQALGAFNSASTTFSNIADDNIADYTEVPYYTDLLNQIVSEYSPISSSAFTQGVTDSSWTNYSQSFVNYSQSLNVIVTTSQIDFPISGINNSPLFLTTRFNDYYNRKSIILDAITIRARSNAEAYALVVTPTDPLTGILKNNPTPSGQGLFMNSQNLGYYNSSNWQTFMSASGEFFLTSSVNGNYLFWRPSTGTLEIQGAINITGGNAVTTSSFDSYSSSVGMEFQTVSASANNALQEALLAQGQALGAFNSASTTFSNIADDNIADYTEVPYYTDLLNQIVSEYSPISSSAFTQGVTDSSWTNYSQSFVNYSQSLNVIVTTSQIDFPISGINNSPLFLTTRFNDYYNRKSIILDAITIQARVNAEAYALVVTPTDPLTGILKNNPTPSGQGLFMNSQNLGYYNSSNWQTFMSASGEFFLTSSVNGNYLFWRPSTGTLEIQGAINITGGNAVTTSSFDSYSSSVGMEFQTVSASANNALQEALLAQGQALGAFNSASTTFSNIADDNIADYTEVPYYTDLLNQIVSEYSPISASAFTQGVSDSSWTNYSQSFINYSQSLDAIVTTSQIDFPISGINNSPLFLTTRFNDYYNRKSIILDAITIQARVNAEAYALVVTPTDPLTGILKNNPTPSGQGLFMNSQNLGFYNSSTWQTFMSASGEFFLTSSVNGNYLFWNPSTGTLEITGAINITGGNGATQQFVNNATQSLSSSVTTTISNLSSSVTNSISNLSSSFTVTTENLDDRIFTNADGLLNKTPNTSSAGLYLGSDFMGFYDGGKWKTYMDNQGDFYLTGSNGYLVWDSSTDTLNILGDIIAKYIFADSGSIGGWNLLSQSLNSNNVYLSSQPNLQGLYVVESDITTPVNRVQVGQFNTLNTASLSVSLSGAEYNTSFTLLTGTRLSVVEPIDNTVNFVLDSDGTTTTGNFDIGLNTTLNKGDTVNARLSIKWLDISTFVLTAPYNSFITIQLRRGSTVLSQQTIGRDDLGDGVFESNRIVNVSWYNNDVDVVNGLTIRIFYSSNNLELTANTTDVRVVYEVTKTTSRVQLTKDQFLLYSSPTNYLQWTPESLIVKSNNAEFGKTSVGDLSVEGNSIFNGNATFLGQVTIEGDLASHPIIPASPSISLSGGNVIQGLGLDMFGHVTSSISTDFDSRYLRLTGGTVSGDVTLDQDLVVRGSMTVLGAFFSASVEEIDIKSNLLKINDGETGNGVTAGIAGIQVDRGTANDFYFLFEELRGKFVVGTAGNTQVVATREDTPINNGVVWFNASTHRIETTTGFIFASNILSTPSNVVLGAQASTTNHAVRADRTITINGTVNQVNVNTPSQDLTANRSWTLSLPQDIHSGATPSFVQLSLTNAGTGTSNAVRADRTLTFSNGVGINSSQTSAQNLTANRSWAFNLTGQALALHNATSSNGLFYRNGTTIGQRSIVGTSDRVTVTNGDATVGNPTIDISSTYTGQTSITTLGTITTGTWNATTIGTLYGGTGQTIYTDGQLLIGNTAGNLTKATLTGTTNRVSVTNGNGSITLSTPQDIHTTASPSFNQLTLNNAGTGTSNAVRADRTITLNSNNGITGGSATAFNLTSDRSWTFGLTGRALRFHELGTDGFVVQDGATIKTKNIVGTTDRITVTNGTSVGGDTSVNIASTYVGQTSITTLGIITTGTWNANIIPVLYGGTSTSSFNSNKLIVGNGTNALQSPIELHWDSVGKYLGVNNVTPQNTVDINGTFRLFNGSGGAYLKTDGNSGESGGWFDSRYNIGWFANDSQWLRNYGDAGILLSGNTGNDGAVITDNYMGSSTSAIGAFGLGWKLWRDATNLQSYLEIDNIAIRNTLRAHIFQKDIVRASNGYLYISDADEVTENVSVPSSGSVFVFHVKEGIFQPDDLLWYKDFSEDGGGLQITGVKLEVLSNPIQVLRNDQSVFAYSASVYEQGGLTAQLRSGGTIVRVGNKSQLGRDGSIYFDASGNASPYMDIYAGVNSFTEFQSISKVKSRLGKLTGVVSNTYGQLEDFGLWTNNLYAEGNAQIAGTITAGDANGVGSTFYAGKIRKNILRSSEQIGNSDWYVSPNVSVTLNGATSPNGDQKASIIQFSGDSSEFILQSSSASSGDKFIFSVYMKLHSGSFVSPSGGFVFASDEEYDVSQDLNDTVWKRYVVRATASQNGDVVVYMRGSDPNVQIAMWGAQLEQSEYVSAYQPTDSTITGDGQYGMWAIRGGFGGTIQAPVVSLGSYGFRVLNNGTSENLTNNSIMVGNINGVAQSSIKINNNGTNAQSGLFGYDTNTSESFALRLDGTANVAGFKFDYEKLYTGVGTFANANTGVFLESTGERFSLGNKLSFSGGNLSVQGDINATSIITDSGSIGGWIIENNRIVKGNVELNSQLERIKLGTITGLTTGNGILLSGSGEFAFNVGTVDYIRQISNSLQISSTTFNLTSSNFHIDSTAERIRLGTTTSFGTGNGLLFGKDGGSYKFYAGNGDKNIFFDGTDVSADNMILRGYTVADAFLYDTLVITNTNSGSHYQYVSSGSLNYTRLLLHTTASNFVRIEVAPLHPIAFIKLPDNKSTNVVIENAITSGTLRIATQSSPQLPNVNVSYNFTPVGIGAISYSPREQIRYDLGNWSQEQFESSEVAGYDYAFPVAVGNRLEFFANNFDFKLQTATSFDRMTLKDVRANNIFAQTVQATNIIADTTTATIYANQVFATSSATPPITSRNVVPIFDTNAILSTSSVSTTELGYLSGVTSAIQTQINSRVSKDDIFVNVKDFGAVGDGVTDDAPAINSAITYAINNYRYTVYIPNTEMGYALGSPILLRDRLSLIGDNQYGGRRSRIVPVTGYTGALISTANFENSTTREKRYFASVKGLFFDGKDITQSAIRVFIQQCYIGHCTFKNISQYGIYIRGKSGVNGLALNNTIEMNYFSKSDGTNMEICLFQDYYGADTRILGNYMEYARKAHMELRGSTAIISNNHLYDGRYGIISKLTFERTICNNMIENIDESAILIEDGSSSRKLWATIGHNIFRNINRLALANAVVEVQGTNTDGLVVTDNVLRRDSSTTYSTDYFVSSSISSSYKINNNVWETGTIGVAEFNQSQCDSEGLLDIPQGNILFADGTCKFGNSTNFKWNEVQNVLEVVGDISIVGSLYATIGKSFRIKDQKNPNKSITYASVETNEYGVTLNGNLKSHNNVLEIKLPEEWEWLVDHDTISVVLTARKMNQKLVWDYVDNKILVINKNIFFNNGVNFSYQIYARRKDVPKLQVYSETI